MKLSKTNVILYFIIGSLLCFQLFVMNPIIKEIYNYNDISNFEKNSWKYSFILQFFVFMISVIYSIKTKKINRYFIISRIILLFIMSFIFKDLTDDLLLYLNSKVKVEKHIKEYIVLRYDPNKVFHIYDKKNEFIVLDEQLKKIDSIRMKKNLKSLFKLHNNDTLNIEYKVGILNVKYIE